MHLRPGLRPGPRWGAYDAPLVGWGWEYPLPIPHHDAFGVPASTHCPGTNYEKSAPMPVSPADTATADNVSETPSFEAITVVKCA